MHVQPTGTASGARLAGPHRGRPRDPARGADASVVLQRRRQGARARGLRARRGRIARAVLHPPSVRIFDGDDFAFANPAAVHGPEDEIRDPGANLAYELRPTAVIGADQCVGGITLMNLITAPRLGGAKARDFALVLGPVVVTAEEDVPAVSVDWERLVSHAARNTRLVPGDLIAADPIATGAVDGFVEVGVEGIGALRNTVRVGS